MDLIRISDSKLKVMLSQTDMERYALDGDRIDYDNTETRRAFWCILDEAKHRTGFDAAGDRVFIQVYQSRNGGCEMYVTKLCGEGGDGVQETSRPIGEERVYCRFESLSDLIGGCLHLRRAGYRGKSFAYYSEEAADRYYLSLSLGGRTGVGRSGVKGLTEYGRWAEGRLLSSYIAEHCRALCEGDAVETLAELA